MPEATADVTAKPAAPQAAPAPVKKEPAPKIEDPRPILRAFTWRGSQSEYKGKFRDIFMTQMIREVVAMTQSESDGNVCITIIYR